jgi:hypothetical protein
MDDGVKRFVKGAGAKGPQPLERPRAGVPPRGRTRLAGSGLGLARWERAGSRYRERLPEHFCPA